MPKEEKSVSKTKLRNRDPVTSSAYVRSVLQLYVDLPHTPIQPSRDDSFVAYRFQLQRVPLIRVHAALLLGSARRCFRAADLEPLTPIRSIRYFLPIIEELTFAHLDSDYIAYLRGKLSEFLGRDISLNCPQD